MAQDEEIDYSGVPELGEGFFKNARLARPNEGGKKCLG